MLAVWATCALGSGQTATPAPAGPKPPATSDATGVPAAPATKLTDKQKALADQTERLLVMATELKDQVAKTNKSVLSVKVVEKAQEIEQYARQLKDQAKK
jgi:type VI protein secretion system component VasF